MMVSQLCDPLDVAVRHEALAIAHRKAATMFRDERRQLRLTWAARHQNLAEVRLIEALAQEG